MLKILFECHEKASWFFRILIKTLKHKNPSGVKNRSNFSNWLWGIGFWLRIYCKSGNFVKEFVISFSTIISSLSSDLSNKSRETSNATVPIFSDPICNSICSNINNNFRKFNKYLN